MCFCVCVCAYVLMSNYINMYLRMHTSLLLKGESCQLLMADFCTRGNLFSKGINKNENKGDVLVK